MGSVQKPTVPVRSLSVVLPCRNEAGNVQRVVEEVLRDAGRFVTQIEVIVVNDGSDDETGSLADAIAAADPRVRVVHHATGRGYGGALRGGFAATSGEWVFYTDGDGQFDVAQLAIALPKLQWADIVAGYRIRRAEGWVRRLNGWAWTRAVSAVFGLRVRDVDCAFKLFPGEFVRGTPLESSGALISAELLARASRAGLRIEQVGVLHRKRIAGEATGADLRVILRAFRELFALSGRIKAGR